MSDQNICDILAIQRRRVFFKKQPLRFDISTPYEQYLKKDLDMRRKAEVLQFNGNKSNTKTNNFTKKMKLAQALKGNSISQKKIRSLIDASGNISTCYVDDLIVKPTSSSDVPGKTAYLYLDNTVPLYNYTTRNNTFNTVNDEEKFKWKISKYDDQYSARSNYAIAGTICMGNLIDKNYYRFKLVTPIGIYMQGYLPNESNSGTVITITGASLKVAFNDNEVTLASTPTYSYDFTDMSFNTNMSSSDLSNNTTFYASQYVGNLTVSNIYLYAQKEYLYDLYLSFSMSYSDADNDFSFYKLGTFTNISSSNVSVTSNCVTNGQNTSETRKEFSFVED